jgi:hypothetical protein
MAQAFLLMVARLVVAVQVAVAEMAAQAEQQVMVA